MDHPAVLAQIQFSCVCGFALQVSAHECRQLIVKVVVS